MPIEILERGEPPEHLFGRCVVCRTLVKVPHADAQRELLSVNRVVFFVDCPVCWQIIYLGRNQPS